MAVSRKLFKLDLAPTHLDGAPNSRETSSSAPDPVVASLEKQLETELGRLQKEAIKRGRIHTDKDVPRTAYDQQHLGESKQRMLPHDITVDGFQTADTDCETDSSVGVDEKLLPAETSAWPQGLHLLANLARTGRLLTRLGFGEAQSARQGAAGAHHQQPPEMPGPGAADPEKMISAHPTTAVNDILDPREAIL